MIAFAVIIYLWAFWAVYVLVMGLYRAHLSGRLRGLNLILALPVLALGYVMDAAANVLIATVLFIDLPREWLVTSRLQRYKATETGWRLMLAEAICEGLLDVFDPNGEHC